jgi:hypothetical protein
MLRSLMISYEYKNHWSGDDQAWLVVLKIGAGGENYAREWLKCAWGSGHRT